MMLLIVICFLMEKKSLNLKLTVKAVNFQIQFCLGNIFNGFSTTESSEVFLNGYGYDFSVKQNSIDKSGIWNIHKYFMKKNNTK